MGDDTVLLEIKSCLDCPRFIKRAIFSSGRFPYVDPDGRPVFFGYEYICSQLQRKINPKEGVNPPPLWCPKRKALPKFVQQVAAYLIDRLIPYGDSLEYDPLKWSEELTLPAAEIETAVGWFEREGWVRTWYSILKHKTYLRFQSKAGYEAVQRIAAGKEGR